MPDDLNREKIETNTKPERSLLIRLQEAFPVAWKHDELFRYALILSALAWLVILFHVSNGTTRYR